MLDFPVSHAIEHGTSEITEGKAVRHVRLANAQERNNLGGKAALEMRFCHTSSVRRREDGTRMAQFHAFLRWVTGTASMQAAAASIGVSRRTLLRAIDWCWCILSNPLVRCEVVPISWTLWWERSPLMVKYTREQRLRAVRLYEQYDRSAASVINELGYPSRQMLVRWLCFSNLRSAL